MPAIAQRAHDSSKAEHVYQPAKITRTKQQLQRPRPSCSIKAPSCLDERLPFIQQHRRNDGLVQRSVLEPHLQVLCVTQRTTSELHPISTQSPSNGESSVESWREFVLVSWLLKLVKNRCLLHLSSWAFHRQPNRS